MFDEVFLPHMAEAYRLAKWLTGNANDAEDVVQEAALRAFRGIKSFGAVNARAWSLTIVRNTAHSWLMKNRPKAVVFTEELTFSEQEELEIEIAPAILPMLVGPLRRPLSKVRSPRVSLFSCPAHFQSQVPLVPKTSALQ